MCWKKRRAEFALGGKSGADGNLFRSGAAHAADQAAFEAIILRLDIGLERRTLAERKDHFVVIALDHIAAIDEIMGRMSGNARHAASSSAFASSAAARTAARAARTATSATTG